MARGLIAFPGSCCNTSNPRIQQLYEARQCTQYEQR
jgi:hypothetical protein